MMESSKNRGPEQFTGPAYVPLPVVTGASTLSQGEITAPGEGAPEDVSPTPEHPSGSVETAAPREASEAPEVHELLRFPVVESNPWTTEHLRGYLQSLGAENPQVTTKDVESIRNCYDQQPQNRSYHALGHGTFVGQPDIPDALAQKLSDRMPLDQAKANAAVSGMWHDAAYPHVDEIDPDGTRAWPTVLRKRINGMADYVRTTESDKPVFTTTLTERGKADPVTQLVAGIFEVSDGGIVHNQGGNEFVSALAAANFLAEKGVPTRSIIGAVAGIAATIPFKPALGTDEQGNITDGHMGQLAQRVHKALLDSGASTPEYAWQDTNDAMLLAVQQGNRDIAPFIKPNNFAEVVHGGRGVKAEEVPALREHVETIRELGRAAGLQRSAPLLYGWFGGKEGAPLVADNVPHIYIPRDAEGKPQGVEAAYPPLPVHHQSVANAKENSRLASTYFVAHELGIALAASIATHIGEPDAPVPGIVHADIWHPQAVVPTADQLSPNDKLLYNELLNGTGQRVIDSATPQRSPIGATIFGALGSEGVAQVSERVQQLRAEALAHGNQDPFSIPATADAFIAEIRDKIGTDNFKMITTELHRVAEYYQDHLERGNRARAVALVALGGGLVEYQ